MCKCPLFCLRLPCCSGASMHSHFPARVRSIRDGMPMGPQAPALAAAAESCPAQGYTTSVWSGCHSRGCTRARSGRHGRRAHAFSGCASAWSSIRVAQEEPRRHAQAACDEGWNPCAVGVHADEQAPGTAISFAREAAARGHPADEGGPAAISFAGEATARGHPADEGGPAAISFAGEATSRSHLVCR